MASPAKVIVIGLDSADRELVRKWCASGELPVLRALRERSAFGELTGPPGLGDDATWASFYTGVSPGRHGRYFWRSLRPGSYETPRFCDEDLERDTFWNVLSRAGRRVAVIDVPKCPLTKGLNGIQVADWHVHGRDHRDTCSWPPDLAPSLLAQFGDDMTDRPGQEWLCHMDLLSEHEYEVFVQRLLEGIERKTKAAAGILAQGNWDLFLVVFKETHCVAHQCWHLLDDSHAAHSARIAQALRNPIKRVYRALDAAIGQLLALAGSESSVIVFSDLGMGPNYTGEHLLDDILIRLERSFAPRPSWFARALRGMKRRIRTRILGGYGALHSRAHRLAYQLEHNEISGAIRVNLQGRERRGRIRPGTEYEEFCQWLTRELLALVNPDTGQRIVDSVLRSESVYKGEHLDRLPDLFVVWSRRAPISAVASPTIGELRVADPAYRTGNHVPGGFYLISGPGVSAGEQCPASIVDLAPTIAGLLRTPLPGTDGKSISALAGVGEGASSA